MMTERECLEKIKVLRSQNAKTKEISKQEQEEIRQRRIEWAVFWRNNIHLYIKYKLQMNVYDFQAISYYLMSQAIAYDELASRGTSKDLLRRKIGMSNEVHFDKNNKLTKEQKQYIDEHYAYMKAQDIGAQLGLDAKRVKWYASNHGLKHDINAFLTWEQTNILRARTEYNYKDYIGNATEEKTDVLYKSKYGKYEVNQHYFDIIDTEWKAYWLGFLYADGCNRIGMRNNKHIYEVSIVLNSNDASHLQKFLDSVQSSAPIMYKDVRLKYNGEYRIFHSCKALVCNRQLSLALNDKGCVPNKSLILQFPSDGIVPHELMRHFIRGYFDGDGHVHINKDNKTINCGFVGTNDFLMGLCEFLETHTDIKPNSVPKKDSRNNCYQIHWNSLSSCHKLFKYLYKDANVYLNRKFAKLNNLFCLDI